MIYLTKLSGTQFVVNADLVETVEATPDTMITLTNGKKYAVTESVPEVIQKTLEYKNRIRLMENVSVNQ